MSEPATLTAAQPVATGNAGLFGVLGASAGTLANSYLDALGKKLAGVNTSAAPADAATADAKKSAATAAPFDPKPLLIVGGVALVGLVVVIALRR